MIIPIIPWCVLTIDNSEMWGMLSNSLWLNLVMRPLRCTSTTDWFINMTWFHFGIQVINAYDSWYHDSSWGKVISLSVMFLWTLSLNSCDCCINPLFFRIPCVLVINNSFWLYSYPYPFETIIISPRLG